jgi:iron transport multicopper oxidase
VGCFEDNASGHVLPQLFSNKSVTPELCIQYANSVFSNAPTPTSRLPYLYVEYHDECYGGTQLAFSGSAVTSLVGTKACSDVCSGSISTVTTSGTTTVVTGKANMCGGPRQFNLYALTLPVAFPTSSGPLVTQTAT